MGNFFSSSPNPQPISQSISSSGVNQSNMMKMGTNMFKSKLPKNIGIKSSVNPNIKNNKTSNNKTSNNRPNLKNNKTSNNRPNLKKLQSNAPEANVPEANVLEAKNGGSKKLIKKSIKKSIKTPKKPTKK